MSIIGSCKIKRNLALATLLASTSVFAASGWDSASSADEQKEPLSVNTSNNVKATSEPTPIGPQSNPAISSGISLGQGLVGGGAPIKAALSETTNLAVGAAQAFGHQYLPTFEMSFSFAENNKPVYGILGVIPLYESKDRSNAVFTQLSSYRTDGRTTVNLGLGNRHLVADQRVMLGVNAFYDHEFPYAHARTSVGAEIRTSIAELNTNAYQAQSGWKTGRDGQTEKAMGGFDLELGVALPYMPQVKAYAKRFQWNASDGAADLKGNVFSLKGALFDSMTIEFGRTSYGGGAQPNSNFISWQVDIAKLLNRSAQARPFFASRAYAFESMQEHLYDKVRRENLIQKQIGRGGFVITASAR